MDSGVGSTWLRVEQVADRLGLSVDQTYRLLKSGRIRSYRVGLRRGRYRVSPSQVEDYLGSCETSETTKGRASASKSKGHGSGSGRADGQPLRHFR